MADLPKRYIFVEYDSLQDVQFDKLDKVCNKVFIVIDKEEEYIPANIVIQAQQLGKRVKWVSAEIEDDNYMIPISFLMGALHHKASEKVEFAVLSDRLEYDTLVHFINDLGRDCLRVRITPEHEEVALALEAQKEELVEDAATEEGLHTLDTSQISPEPIHKFRDEENH